MGYMSNQWLNRGMGSRSRSYHPVSVTVSCHKSNDSWSQNNQVTAQLTARQTNHEYQTVHVTQAECDSMAPTIVGCMSSAAREQLIIRLLREPSSLSGAASDSVAESVVANMSIRGRESLITDLLRRLSRAKLLRALAIDLSTRVRLPKKRQPER